MILKNELYKIASTDMAGKAFDVDFIAESLIYRAHFPEMPITPGVCIIQIATELLQELVGADLEVLTVKNAKFLIVINPQETPSVTYRFKKVDEDVDAAIIKASVEVVSADKVFTKLSLVYKKK